MTQHDSKRTIDLRTTLIAITLAAFAAAVLGSLIGQRMQPDGVRVSGSPVEPLYIIEPTDGAIVSGEFTVKFGLRGLGVAPAGVKFDGTGHHHLLIDVTELPDMTRPLPATDQIRHFGKGQTETTLTLPPGKHTLQLLLGNYIHVPHDPPLLSQPITIQVR